MQVEVAVVLSMMTRRNRNFGESTVLLLHSYTVLVGYVHIYTRVFLPVFIWGGGGGGVLPVFQD